MIQLFAKDKFNEQLFGFRNCVYTINQIITKVRIYQILCSIYIAYYFPMAYNTHEEVICMIFERKIYEKLLKWKKEANGREALLIEGARRVGKSTIVEEFAKNEYVSYLLIDFARITDETKGYFRKFKNDLDTLFMMVQNVYGVELKERKSLIILMRYKCSLRQGK